jgi:nicotinate-nucleotide adenylyltransferase
MRLGVFGGTFDPVHFGHLRTVEAAASTFGLRRVIYVPARLSPLKTLPATDPRHRVAMLALALAGRPDWPIWLGELDREAPSYTVDTLRALSRENPDDELWLLLGTDTLAGFDRWREPEEIVRLARVAAFLREPFAGPGLSTPVRLKFPRRNSGETWSAASEPREGFRGRSRSTSRSKACTDPG